MATSLQVLDAHGLNLVVGKFKDGSVMVGKAAVVAASGIEGTIPLEKLPAAALERIKVVATDAARLALTKSDVQNGDIVKVTGTGKMFAVIDDSKLGQDGGWTEFVAGTAAKASSADSVPWSGVSGKPSSFTPSAHSHSPAQVGMEAIDDATLEAILGGTFTE